MTRRGIKAQRFYSERPSMHELLQAAERDHDVPPKSFRGLRTEVESSASPPASSEAAPASGVRKRAPVTYVVYHSPFTRRDDD